MFHVQVNGAGETSIKNAFQAVSCGFLVNMAGNELLGSQIPGDGSLFCSAVAGYGVFPGKIEVIFIDYV